MIFHTYRETFQPALRPIHLFIIIQAQYEAVEGKY